MQVIKKKVLRNLGSARYPKLVCEPQHRLISGDQKILLYRAKGTVPELWATVSWDEGLPVRFNVPKVMLGRFPRNIRIPFTLLQVKRHIKRELRRVFKEKEKEIKYIKESLLKGVFTNGDY